MSRVYCKLLPVLMVLVLTGCGAAVTQYYVLNTIASKPNQTVNGALNVNKTLNANKRLNANKSVQQIAIRQLEIPRYLDRPRMVSRDAENHLRISETHQWGGRLRDDLARTLSDNLAERLGSVAVFTAPFPGSMHADVSFLIDVRQFELLADGHVYLKVRWHIQQPGQATLSYFNQMHSEAMIKPTDYAAIAAAMSQLVAQLSDNMAMAIVNLSKPLQQTEP